MTKSPLRMVTLSLLLTSGPWAMAQQRPLTRPLTPPPTEAARITFKETMIDFGKIDDTRPVSCEFRFENSGKAALRIAEIKASCGCTATELSKKIFAPGEGDALKVDWTPKGTGRQAKTIDVTSNSQPGGKIRLTVKAEIDPYVEFEPGSLDFGQVKYGTAQVAHIVARCADPTMEIVSVTSTNPVYHVRVVPGDEAGQPEAAAVVVVSLTNKAPKGRVGTSVRLKIRGNPPGSSGPVTYDKSIYTKASVHGEIQTEPYGFLVGLVPPKGSVDQDVKIIHPEGKGFSIIESRIECSVEGLTLDIQPLTGEERGYTMILKGPVGDFLGRVTGKVTLLTDLFEEGPVELPIMGIVRPVAGR